MDPTWSTTVVSYPEETKAARESTIQERLEQLQAQIREHSKAIEDLAARLGAVERKIG